MSIQLTRKRFVQGSAAMGAGLVVSEPLTALAARGGSGAKRPKAIGFGAIAPKPEASTGELMLALPDGFSYRLLQRSGAPMTDGNPCPGIFDGMGAYRGPNRTTILIRNHENRSRAGEIAVAVPAGKRYDADANVRGGLTKLVLDADNNLLESYAILGGTHTNCAGGETPWGSWITCEEIFNYGATQNNVTPGTGVPHGYAFEVAADVTGPVTPQPIIEAGRFSREAVAWLDGALYQTEDRGDAAFYRFVPSGKPKRSGDLAANGGRLEALVITGRPNFDANLAQPGETFDAEWTLITEPNPLTDTVRKAAQSQGAAIFDRTEGIWTYKDRVYFDCTTGGEAQLGQLWELVPRPNGRDRLRLVYEAISSEDLQNPDNVVVVPATGDVLLQEDGDGEQFVRGVTGEGTIYDFASTVLSDSEFCGGCFSPDGGTLFLNQQGSRLAAGETPESQPLAAAGLTYAITGPFVRRR